MTKHYNIIYKDKKYNNVIIKSNNYRAIDNLTTISTLSIIIYISYYSKLPLSQIKSGLYITPN